MSLDTAKLEKARELAGGIVQARCPACAEGGGDRKGEHLRVYPDGRYGCCVHPKDSGHRKRIFALAGERKPGTFTLRLKTPPAVLAVRSVKAVLAAPCLMPPETELESGVRGVRDIPTDDSRTPRTGISKSRARTRGDSSHSRYVGMDSHMKLEDLESGVRGVRAALPAITRPAADDLGTLGTPETESENAVPGVLSVPGVGVAEPPSDSGERVPFLTAGGTLSIPFDSPERYHWWKPPHDQRQRVATTWDEVKERMKHAAALGGGNPKSEDRRPKAESEEEYYGDGV